jgi:5'-AMP-activated protein kinase catalytic alpha subunit
MDNNEDTPLKENKELEEEEEILSVPPEDMTDINDPEQKKKIMCDFIIKEVIGEGTFATVRLAINKQTGQKVAIKIMEKNKIVHQEDRVRIEREIKVLKNLRHPNIVHLYSVIKTEEKIYLIMEYVKGKELFDYIVMKKKLSESESCLFFQQIISGIEYLHKIKYVHRDIKPENLLINEETKELKIVDFGLSNIYTNPNKHLLSSACGSPSYAAPEMLNGEKYRAQPVDIWSCGIVLYAMICGYLPFEDEDNEALYDKICRGKFVIPNHVTENARDLINKILVTDPKKRLTIYQIKHHPWFSLYNDKGKLMISDGLVLSKIVEPIDEEVVSSMNKTFNLPEQKIRISILSNKHDDITTIYYLLLQQKVNNKKKSIADIKSDLFKKYCENKNNLFENYEKDLNKVLEERKNGYSYNIKNSQSKILSSNLSDIHRKLNINEQNSPDKKNNENKSSKKHLNTSLKTRYLSPDVKGNRIIRPFNTNREKLKTSQKQQLQKLNTNNTPFKSKLTTSIKEINDKHLINSQKGKKEINNKNKNISNKNANKGKGISINGEAKKNENKNDDNEDNKCKNLIKYREKKVHYEKKKDKPNNYTKSSISNKASSKIKINNDLKRSTGSSNKNGSTNRNRIKSAIVSNYSDKKNKTKQKNDLNTNDLKKSSNSNYDIIHIQRAKNKNQIKSKSTFADENEEKSNKKEKLAKLNTFKSPIKTSININNNKLNIKSKVIQPIEKIKKKELTERGVKKINIFNKGGGVPKTNKEIILSDSSKKSKKVVNTNIIYKKKEPKTNSKKNRENRENRENKENKEKKENKDKQEFVTFNTNNNVSQELYNKLLGNHKIKPLKHFSSYNAKSNNKLINKLDNSSDKNIQDKLLLFKRNAPILEMENNEYDNSLKDSNIDENSFIISNKKLNCYEPFDLNFAYIKPRKILKEKLTNILDNNKNLCTYEKKGNTRYKVKLKNENEDLFLGIKFDKLNYLKDDNIDENKNDVRISIIKFRRLNGNYQIKMKSFEKLLFQLN